jgi:phosphate transport system substrate-binding protein
MNKSDSPATSKRRKMNKKFVATAAALAVVSSLFFTGGAAQAATALSGKGSSFAANAIAYCAAHYDPASNDTVTYTSTGSSTGRTEFAASNVQFAVSDGPYTSGFPTNRYVNVPLLGGPVVFAYNKLSKKVPAGLHLTAAIASGIFKGTITKWNDKAIAKVNAGKKLPAKAINVYYRTSGSGTTANLTTYLYQVLGGANSGWANNSKDLQAAAGGTLAANAKAKATSAIIADLVQSDPYGFGYFDLSDAVSAKVNAAALQNAKGQFVAPTAAAAAKFLSAQSATKDSSNTLAGDATDGTLSIDFTKKVTGAYQLSIVTYGIANRGSSDAKDIAVKNFFSYVVNTCMPAKGAALGYVALTGGLKTTALGQIAAISNN